jgi:hypothetical protein
MHPTFRWLLPVVLAGMATSCWNDFEELSYSSANLKSFSFEKQDTCRGIENIQFFIDQVNGLVFNIDSLPYGSKVDYLVPSLSYYSTNGQVLVDDTLPDVNQDTLDFSSPLKLTNTSADGQYTRSYWVHINIHQVDPDAMVVTQYPASFPTTSAKTRVFPFDNGSYRAYFPTATGLSAYVSTPTISAWSGLTVTGLDAPVDISSLSIMGSNWYVAGVDGSLYVSPDGLAWTQQPSTFSFVTLYGSLNRKYVTDPNPQYLVGLVKDDAGVYYGARSADGATWEKGKALGIDFPVKEAAHVRGKTATKVQFMTVMSGLNAAGNAATSIWSTEDGLNWILVKQSASLPICGLKGNNLVYYGGQLISFGGVRSTGGYEYTVLLSKDHGRNWTTPPEKWDFPELSEGLAYGSLLVETQEDSVNEKDRLFFWYFGGENAGQVSGKVWKACEHQMLFLRR